MKYPNSCPCGKTRNRSITCTSSKGDVVDANTFCKEDCMWEDQCATTQTCMACPVEYPVTNYGNAATSDAASAHAMSTSIIMLVTGFMAFFAM